MLASVTSTILVAGILGFLLVASGVLVWDGLAAGVAAAHPTSSERRRARLRLAVGLIAFALTLWVALGMLSHAW